MFFIDSQIQKINLELISLFHWISMRTGHLPDWSSPDDPARVLAAVGRLNPSYTKYLEIICLLSIHEMQPGILHNVSSGEFENWLLSICFSQAFKITFKTFLIWSPLKEE